MICPYLKNKEIYKRVSPTNILGSDEVTHVSIVESFSTCIGESCPYYQRFTLGDASIMCRRILYEHEDYKHEKEN